MVCHHVSSSVVPSGVMCGLALVGDGTRRLSATPTPITLMITINDNPVGGDATLIGDEGGFAPPCDARGGVELVMEAISSAGYEGKCTIGECLGRLLPRFKRLPMAPDGASLIRRLATASFDFRRIRCLEGFVFHISSL